MNTTLMAIILVIGMIGHAINLWCDRALSIFPSGRITFASMNDVNDPVKLAQIVKGADPERAFKSAMYGAAAVFMHFLGYAAIAAYVYSYQQALGLALFFCAALFAVLGAGHHVKYALGLWMFLRGGCDRKSHQLLTEIMNKLPVTKAAYFGYILYVILLIVTIAIGVTPLPLWALIFTVLPIFLVMVPFKIIGTMHFSAIITFVGWLFMILFIH